MNETKHYQQMTDAERLAWVRQWQAFTATQVPRLQTLVKQHQPWTQDDRRQMEAGLRLLAAFPFADKFVQDALRYGDLSARVGRLPIYIQKVSDELAATLSIREQNGQRVVVVDPTVPARRRGRPSREEMAARRRGEALVLPDTGAELPRRIAQLIGYDVVLTDRAPREKNNAELAVIRQQRQAEYARQNPSLFDTPPAPASPAPVVEQPAPAAATVPDGSPSGSVAPATPANIAAGNAPEYRLTLHQKAPFMSRPLAERAEQVREIRHRLETASERAKLLAEQGRPAKDIEPYCQEAERAVKDVEQIYADVNAELATLYYRLLNDEPYKQKWLKRYGLRTADDINADLLHDLRLHYRKMQSPDFDLRCRTLIEQESPEYMAQVKAREARDEEVRQILRYLRRTDKPNALTRRNTARQRFARLQELLGQQEAAAYRPFLTKIEDDYDRNFRPADEAKAKAATVPVGSAKGKKQETKKPSKQSSKQETKKSSKEETKQVSKKTNNQGSKQEKKKSTKE